MSGRSPYALWLVLLTIAATPVWAVTRNVPADFLTIQAAVTAADPGDTVLVAAGTYYGTVSISEDITLLGAAGAGSTTISGTPPVGPSVRPVHIFSSATVDGFTLTGGFATLQDGGGVWINGSGISPTVRNCLIVGNAAHNDGGGVFALNGASVVLDHCTIAGNSANNGSGGALGVLGSSTSMTVNSCILWGNTPDQILTVSGTATVTYSDVQGGFAGTGNINSDPLFNNAGAGDYSLGCGSPCIGTGASGTDMGAFPESCTPATVTVSGTVTSDCHGALAGVTVDLLPGSGGFLTTHTDASGAFTFADVAFDAVGGEISILMPLGYQAGVPAGGEATIVLDQDRVQGFAVLCLPPAGVARSKNYWKHEASVVLKGHGNGKEDPADMTTNFPNAIFDHFHENQLNGIAVEGVTYMAGPVPLDLATIVETLKKKDFQVAKAKQQYLAVLLNMASGRILTSTVVSTDGATASQAIQYIADLLNGTGPYGLAEDIAETMNDASLVAAGVIPLTYDDIAYARPRDPDLPLRVFPNPGSAARDYVFSFGMPVAGEAALEIFDVAGRRVAAPLAGVVEAGRQELRWDGRMLDGRRVGQGMYFARLVTAGGSKTVKLVHLAQ